jgi:serine/threonine-protein kinase
MIEVGKKFGLNDRYEILEILGEGGMGIVLKAYDTILKEMVAIKTLHSKLANDKFIKNRFLNEAKLCLALTHPNIIRVRDVSIYNNIYYMVMEYIQGVELKSILPTLDISDIKSIYKLIRPILEALDYAHNYTIHRDIKPANIMIKDNKAYLMDFGISKALEDSELQNHTIIGGMGTKKYASPEQMFNANDVDKRTDIYSMGIMLYQLFTKKIPKNTAVEQPEKPSNYNSKISPLLDNVILKMIESKPNMRQNNFKEVIDVLDNIILTMQTSQTQQELIDTKQDNKDIFDLDLNNMIRIPSGEFLRGSGLESKISIEKPRKTIFLDEFYISKYCVTNEEYNQFLKDTNYKVPKNFEENLKNKPNHPVVYVSYNDAKEYCKYKNVSLPTEAQWEKVAKGGKNFIYPWGNKFEINNVNIANTYNDTIPVDNLDNGKSVDGIYNLAGNVWEWCEDDFVDDFYKRADKNNPVAKENSEIKVLRGGSFDFIDNAARTSFRFHAHNTTCENNIGFRVVKNLDDM